MREHVLFIHSTGTGSFLFDQAAPPEVLGDLVKLAPSNLGYPPGSPLARGEKVTSRDDAKHVLSAIRDDAERIHIVAHSYGGLVAMKMLPVLGKRVVSMWLYEPVLFRAVALDPTGTNPDVERESRHFTDHDWFLNDDERGGTDAWLEIFIDYWNGPGAWKGMPDKGRAYAQRLGWKMYQEVRSVFFDDTTPDAFRLNVPLTLVLGERSPAMSHAMTRGMSHVNPHAKVDHLPKLGHMALLTKGDALTPSIQQHLTAHRSR